MTVCGEVIAIGDELLHGAALDTNSKWLAAFLESIGVIVQRFTVVGDDQEQGQAAVAQACQRAAVVVLTGGLGPTLDDRTRDVVAAVAGTELVFSADSWQQIQDYLRQRGRPVPDSNRRQALLPHGARALDNQHGTAPGFWLALGRAQLFALPGVPREMREMAERHLRPALAALPGLTPIAQHLMLVLGPSEARLGEVIAPWMLPGREPAVGITAAGGLLTIRIVARAAAPAAAAAACAATAAELRPLLGAWLLAEGDRSLPELVLAALREQHASVAFAESCTGGLLASRLVECSGASAVLRGGVVAYSNDSKRDLLGVGAALLDEHGAVSEACVLAMAAGARARFAATYAVATSGIAGPDGGTPDKPVGTVWFALAGPAGTQAWREQFPDFGRSFVRERAVLTVWRALLAAVRGELPYHPRSA